MTHPVRTALGGVALILMSATAAFALPAYPHQRAELFATCTGRLSALATRQQARRDAAAGETRALAEAFETMLDAVMPHAAEGGVSWPIADRWRWSGWGEIAALMAEVDYNLDAGVATRARARAEGQIALCRAILLPPAAEG